MQKYVFINRVRDFTKNAISYYSLWKLDANHTSQKETLLLYCTTFGSFDKNYGNLKRRKIIYNITIYGLSTVLSGLANNYKQYSSLSAVRRYFCVSYLHTWNDQRLVVCVCYQIEQTLIGNQDIYMA